ncbi:TRAP-type C4-dicarboxylate transport system permease small subunit [Okibacterium sp. HSC-33S16]|uniref:GAP family protein n=1 Tax=Okibacterium sp. HSC-33S16 TaxID=2910965 RepID=UPI0020A10380|nr:GAP family protein [Okibacterium sp. HSC-33S16]MCP2032255.1 TRAP-type C4-dicarboxylate transport system permease small subunit [Okibacterium sp. HSC-33S16]
MGSVIGEILTAAIGIALSPLPLIAAITLMLSPRSGAAGLGFLGGWLLGVIVPVVAVTVVATLLPESAADASRPIAGILRLILGALLIVLAVRQWRLRPLPGRPGVLPQWMTATETMTVGQGIALGCGLGALAPKNLALGIAAGLTVGGADLGLRGTVVVLLIFVVIAFSTVLVAVVGYQIATEAWQKPLADLRTWLVRNGPTVLAVAMLLLGAELVGDGISSF